jgi:hypothetical protein
MQTKYKFVPSASADGGRFNPTAHEDSEEAVTPKVGDVSVGEIAQRLGAEWHGVGSEQQLTTIRGI